MFIQIKSFIKYTLILICALVCVSLSASSAYAKGEYYGWEDKNKNTIQVSGGDYSVGFTISKAGGNFTDSGIVARDKVSGCSIFVTVSSVNSAGTKATAKVELDAVTAITDGSCKMNLASDISTRFDKNITIDQSNIDRESLNNTSVKVRAIAKGGDFPASKDTITIKKNNGNQVAKKAASDKTDGGLEVTFPDIPYGQYSACSKALELCENFRHDAKGPLLATTVTITKDFTPPEGGDGGANNCKIDYGIGWIVCPIVRFISGATDASYSVVSAMLTVQPLSMDTSNDTYKAWQVMRNIANICFVIAFLLIIYSQMTSMGIGNYGIKKMLPKLIVAAILVNVSYWICAIAVDLSNVVGTSLKDLIDGLNNDLFNEEAQSGQGGWSKLAAAVLVGGGALFVGLSAFLPMVILAVMAIVTVLLVLTLRQGLIILLIVISPLAFVAYLLPNTEQWFKRWMSTFQMLLLMFPIIALVFAASSLAGTIIGNSANDAENEGMKIAIQVMAAGVTIIPLFITPIIMKAAGGVLGKVGAFVNNPNKGPFDRMRKGAEGYRDRRKNLMQGRRVGVARRISDGDGGALGKAGSRRRRTAAWVGGLGATRSVTSAEQDKYAKASADAAGRNYVAERSIADASYATKLANGDQKMTSLVQAYGKQAVREEDEKDVKAQQSRMADWSQSDLYAKLQDVKGAEKSERAAAARLIAENGGHQHVQQAYDYLMKQGNDPTTQESIRGVQELAAEALLRRKPAGVGASQANDMKSGTMHGSGLMDTFAGRLEDGKFGAQEIASMDLDDHIRIAEMAASGKLSDPALAALSAQLAEINTSDTMKLTPEQQRILTDATYRMPPRRPDGSGYTLTPL